MDILHGWGSIPSPIYIPKQPDTRATDAPLYSIGIMGQVAGIITHTTFNKSNHTLVPLCEVVDTPRGVACFFRGACVYISGHMKKLMGNVKT